MTSEEELVRAATTGPWRVWFTERGDGVKQTGAEVRFAPPTQGAPSTLLGRTLVVVAKDRHGCLWRLTVRPHRVEWIERLGEVELQAQGIGAPERIGAERAATVEADRRDIARFLELAPTMTREQLKAATWTLVALIVGRAVAEERERCARVAEGCSASDIAEAIRSTGTGAGDRDIGGEG